MSYHQDAFLFRHNTWWAANDEPFSFAKVRRDTLREQGHDKFVAKNMAADFHRLRIIWVFCHISSTNPCNIPARLKKQRKSLSNSSYTWCDKSDLSNDDTTRQTAYNIHVCWQSIQNIFHIEYKQNTTNESKELAIYPAMIFHTMQNKTKTKYIV